MIRRSLTAVCIVCCIMISSLNAQRDVIDRIVAIVGGEIILASELAGQMQLVSLQTGRSPRTSNEIETLRDETLEGMVSDRLFLIAAKEDTSIEVRSEEIDRALDEHIDRMRGNFGSDEDFERALAEEGLSVRELRKRFQGEVENQLLKQRFIQKKLYGVSVSRYEVVEFYEEFKDSIPRQPEALRLAHILLPFEVSQKVEDSVKEFAEELRSRALDGADFAALSAQNSSFGAGANGGDLGYVSRSDVVPEFERAAFNLSPGDISGVIRTQFGYHIIKSEGQQGDKMRLRHILLGVTASAEDSSITYKLADSLLTEARSGTYFEELAKIFSADSETRALGGELGWIPSDKLPQDFAKELVGWNTPGELRGPVVSQFGLYIIKLLDYQLEREYTLEDDFDEIKEFARQDKTGKLVDESIQELKKSTFIEYHLDSL